MALTEVETVIGELKSASRRREEESRHINNEVLALKELIPKAMEGQKESTDAKLTDLNNELKSLKKLMEQRSQRPGGAASPAPVPAYSVNRYAGVSSSTPATNTSTEAVTPKPATVRTESGTAEATASINGTKPSSTFSPAFGTGLPTGRASIPAWQMAAASAPAAPAPGVDATSAPKGGEAAA